VYCSVRLDFSCEYELARGFLTKRELLAEGKYCRSYVREDSITALDFYIIRELSSLESEKSFCRGIKNKVFKSGPLYVFEILFTLGDSVKMIFIVQKYINIINGNL